MDYKTNTELSLQIEQAFQPYTFYKFWSSFACPIKSILKRNKKKTEIKREKDLPAKTNETSKGLFEKSSWVVFLRAL